MHGQADGHLMIEMKLGMKLGGCGSRLICTMALGVSDLPHVFARTRTGTAST